jgi:epoxyqueuosine reductase
MKLGQDEKIRLIQDKVQKLGLLACNWLPVSELFEEQAHLEAWISENRHGEMGYMARNMDKRLNPKLLVENAKTILVVLLNYFPNKTQINKETPVISKYAYGTDYHFVLKDKLKKLLQFIQDEIQACGGRAFVDSAPVLERAWAKKAGLGWIGKNSNLISADHGSFFFIGELIIDIELPHMETKLVRDHCGNCTKCIDACPTKAIVSERVIDARKCISYQTIELRGDLDENLKGQFDNRVFGCDICQDVCPWNLKSEAHNEPGFNPHPKLLQLKKEEWNTIDKPLFNELFRNSAVKRTGFKGLQRNLKFLNNG